MSNLAFEIADAIVNDGGYADDSAESDRRADERDRILPLIETTLRAELGLPGELVFQPTGGIHP